MDEITAARESLSGLAKESRELVKTLGAQRKEAEKARDDLRSSAGSAAQGALGAGISALGQRGAGGADFALGVAKGITDSLPAVMSALGALKGGPAGAAVGLTAAAVGKAAYERTIGTYAGQRERAIAEVASLGQSRAAVGQPLNEQQIAELYAAALVREMRKTDFAAAVRSKAPLLPPGNGGR